MANLTGYAQAAPYPTSDWATTPWPQSLGTEGVDGAGNKYLLCSTTSNGNIAPEMLVHIASDFTLTALSTAVITGPVGLVADLTKAGNTLAPVSPFPCSAAIWIQIYGRGFVQLGGGGVSTSDAANGPTSTRTSAAIRFSQPTSATTPVGAPFMTSEVSSAYSGALIRGLTVASDQTVSNVSVVTAVSATHRGERVAVYLNYPEVEFDGLQSVS